jgi:hypothetical protein
MKVAILDDYFDTLRTLRCFTKLAPFDVMGFACQSKTDLAHRSLQPTAALRPQSYLARTRMALGLSTIQ